MAKELLFSVSIRDCNVECIASRGGNGGQNKNRRHTTVRITHPPSGAVGFSGDENNQLKNKQAAFRRMAESKEFRAWHAVMVAELTSGKSIEQLVDEAMAPSNLRIEVRAEGGWSPE